MDEKKLHNLRQEIDSLDDQILDLLNKRADVVVEVGKTKDDSQGVYYVPSREKAIFERLIAKNEGPFPNEGIRRVFREIISASLSLEQPMKVAFLGPQATYTHVAAMRQFGLSAQLVPLKSIPSIFDEVSRGRASYGVVPV
ncbi:MAG: chorismate mutase, partial [Gammaproteobacteria bacterium]|nr:chorismate mutase [Gammaproteobacteria bacterium]NIT06803.1 chorismate mutase [Gammaproteobacteria bacterium]NIT42300.1 chorismate mutase [Gammaproteobacteria bacterium]